MSNAAQFPFVSRGTGGPVPDLAPPNFFLNFDVFFFRARGYFEIQPASAATP